MQWEAGFGRVTRDEPDTEVRAHLLDYMIAVFKDAQDVPWIAAKASHMLLLRVQGEVLTHKGSDKIDRIRRPNAQGHVPSTQATVNAHSNKRSNTKVAKSMICTYFNQGSCVHNKNPRGKGEAFGNLDYWALNMLVSAILIDL